MLDLLLWGILSGITLILINKSPKFREFLLKTIAPYF